ncbi:unnamed protein product [Rotaria sordida]|uniref:G-protein coupled receptors family 1 profile domain-containing protein n=1 Tax=Rotaria sordida TaxID=392033 RepID=A0A819D804_9BILA|nr:unnamed protein product [Rotaria sordida]
MNSSQIVILNITMKMLIKNPMNSSSIIISIIIGICLSLIAFITALGNIVVLLAFYFDKKLRTINDYFILNMAIADFLVGFFCIPFYIPFSITQSWPFGRLFCKIWVTIDDVATMASVINIVGISINRYWSIGYPISYRKYARLDFVYIVMGFVWFISFINFAPGIWLFSLFDKENVEKSRSDNDCSGDYHKSFVYMLIAQFNYFIWPFILLCILNMLIMINICKRTRKMTRSRAHCEPIKTKENVVLVLVSSRLGTSKDTDDGQSLSILSKHNINLIEESPSRIIKEKKYFIKDFSQNKNLQTLSNKSSSNNSPSKNRYLSSYNHNKYPNINNSSIKSLKEIDGSSPIVYLPRKCSNVNKFVSDNYRQDSITEYQFENENDTYIENNSSKSISNKTISSNRLKIKSQLYSQIQSRIIRDRKAARSLFILVVVFIIFLLPYVICATASTAGLNVSKIIFEISFWLLWMNSACNPFLYPFIQIKYRRAYINLFRSCRKYFTFSQ